MPEEEVTGLEGAGGHNRAKASRSASWHTLPGCQDCQEGSLLPCLAMENNAGLAFGTCASVRL
jgi:hypothetical protein